ncbi:MAG: hypothetical protein AB1405_11990 [Bdellovibrionota bacterium]
MARAKSDGEVADWLAIDPLVAEKAVEAKLDGPSDALRARLERDYRKEAEKIYAAPFDERGRELAFSALYQKLFARLGYEGILWSTLKSFPQLPERVAQVVVLPAHGEREEGADLSAVTGNEGRRAALRLRAERFAKDPSIRALLSFHWLQLDDLASPAFGYGGQGLSGDLHPAEQRAVLETYSLLWGLWTDARLTQRGLGLPGESERRKKTAETAFARNLREDDFFRSVLRGEALTHSALLQAARDLRLHAPARSEGLCSLCRFPSQTTQNVPALPEGAARAALLRDYPALSGPVCAHCFERYEFLAEGAMAPAA